jgi:hypothetical protein
LRPFAAAGSEEFVVRSPGRYTRTDRFVLALLAKLFGLELLEISLDRAYCCVN